VDQIPIKKLNKQKKDTKAPSDDASAATAPAGAPAVLHQQNITGNIRQHQLRYDLSLFCPPSKDADKTLMAAAKKWFTKAKEIDATCVLYHWYTDSTSSKLQDPQAIPDKMGAFKAFFHQASPQVDGGFYTCIFGWAMTKIPRRCSKILIGG
jgi:hypothetical protein